MTFYRFVQLWILIENQSSTEKLKDQGEEPKEREQESQADQLRLKFIKYLLLKHKQYNNN